MSKVRWLLVLSENWTIVDPNDMKSLVRIAQEAEGAGIDAVMLSEHIVLGRSAGSNGVMTNPREYAYPGNQPPDMSWPNSIVLLSAITPRWRRNYRAITPPALTCKRDRNS